MPASTTAPNPQATPSTAPASERAFDLIVFDWDGTLYDSTAVITRCIQSAVADVGGTVPSAEDAAYVIGMALLPALAHAAPDVPISKHPELAERYRHYYHHYQNDLILFDGVLSMLHALKARSHMLAVATGKTRRGLDEALHTVQLKGMFHSSRTADETQGKPHPQMLHELMDELNVAPERVVMVGDTTHDLQLARNAGCASIGVSYGAHDSAAFEALAPRFVAHSVPELHQWLLANG